MRIPKFKETIEIRENKTAYSTTNETGEIKIEYQLINDTTDIDGIRTVKLKPSTRNSSIQEKRKELVQELLKGLGEKDSKAFAGLLENAINSHGFEIIEELHQKVVDKKEPLKTRKGCFEIVIGNGKGALGTIQLR